jgi:tetratricopeptide (TPR) repeat protein
MLLPIAAVIICFIIDRRLGAAVMLAACAYVIYSNVPSFYATKGNKAFAAGDNDKALEWYKRAYDTGRASVMIRVSYCFVMMRAGLFEDAEAMLSSMLAQKSIDRTKRNVIKQYRSMALYKLGRCEEAEEEAEEVFAEYKNSSMYGILGYFKLMSDKISVEEKRAFCEEAYDYNSDDRDIIDNMTVVCMLDGDYESALEYAQKLIDKNPQFVEAYYHGAQAAYALGDMETALEYLERTADCTRSAMTTVSEEEIAELKEKCSGTAQ